VANSAKHDKYMSMNDLVSFGSQRVSPEDKRRLVQDHFDTVAPRYDLTNTLLSFGLQHVWKRHAVAMLQLKPGERVVDVCGGTADLALLAAQAVLPAGRLVVYDFNRAMMALGQDKVREANLTHAIAFVQGDAESLALPDRSFDAAMVGFGIRNLSDMVQGLREMHRVLKPGGRIMILEFSQPTKPWFKALYDFYSFTVMPLVGQIMVGSWQAYTYLPESIRLFPSPGELSETLRGLGFAKITYQPLSNGIAVAHVGKKS
jgi:demethylmenaquinone methyltransferase/2-methoxy-6-polyprenyl-1,4-benzoquinol methylase